MTPRSAAPRTPARPRNAAISELAVMVQFGELVVAIAAQRVARIVMADEAVPAPGATPSVQIGGAVLPAWDLGKLLGFSEPPAAWLIMATGDEPGAPEIAVGTGPCISVSSHHGISPLPPGVIAAPFAAVAGVFATDAVLRERGAGHLGLRVDPLRLIGAPALAAARRGER
ncbi:MAG TPA: hypothetical protein VGD37_19150 [Kofleriaceae bacterium]